MSKFVRQADSQKWGDSSYDEEKFMLTIADMDIPIFESLKKKIIDRVAVVNNFTYKNPSKAYYQSIIDWHKQRHIKDSKVDLQSQDIVDSPSILNTIYLLIQGLTKEGDGILLTTPVFSYYARIATYLKRKVIESRLYNQKSGNSSRFDINYSDLEQKAQGAKIMIFCNPHNPTGRIWNEKQINKIVSICKQNNILLISDEILLDLTPENRLSQAYSLINAPYSEVVVCNSISKAFNAQSLKGGYAIFKSAAVRNVYKEMIDQLNLNTNQFAALCTELFYSQEGRDWLAHASSIVKQNYAYLAQKIEGTKLVVSELESAYIIVVSFEGYIKFIERWYNCQNVKEVPLANMVGYFLEKQGINGITLPYANQNGILADIRLTIAIEPSLFRKFVDKLIASLYEIQYQFREINAKL